MQSLRINNLAVPDRFPAQPYERIYDLVVGRWANHANYDDFAGAWSAVAYRYSGAVDSRYRFVESLNKFGDGPDAAERGRQETYLFGFFSGAFSVFESAFYGAYSVCAMNRPNDFPFATPKDKQQVTPTKTKDRIKAAFPDDAVVASLERFLAKGPYQQIKETRNILSHRAAPGRRIYVGLGDDDAPAAQWKLNDATLDAAFLPAQQAALEMLLGELLLALLPFFQVHAKKP